MVQWFRTRKPGASASGCFWVTSSMCQGLRAFFLLKPLFSVKQLLELQFLPPQKGSYGGRGCASAGEAASEVSAWSLLIMSSTGPFPRFTLLLRARESGPELCICVRSWFSGPPTFLRPWSGSSDTLCLLLLLPLPNPHSQALPFSFQFSDFRWKREKMACDLAGFNRRANKRGR